MTKKSEYSEEDRLDVRSTRAKYLFVYPMWKKREWYRLAADERMRIMRSHIETGQRYPTVSINTTYSYGIDDQEFVVAFETNEPGDFLDLVHELRSTESSLYTESETPIFTCVSASVRKALDSLDGARPRSLHWSWPRRRPSHHPEDESLESRDAGSGWKNSRRTGPRARYRAGAAPTRRPNHP
jgi:hypothetical protein